MISLAKVPRVHVSLATAAVTNRNIRREENEAKEKANAKGAEMHRDILLDRIGHPADAARARLLDAKKNAESMTRERASIQERLANTTTRIHVKNLQPGNAIGAKTAGSDTTKEDPQRPPLVRIRRTRRVRRRLLVPLRRRNRKARPEAQMERKQAKPDPSAGPHPEKEMDRLMLRVEVMYWLLLLWELLRH